MAARFKRTKSGMRVRLEPAERELLARLPQELREAYDSRDVRERLFPRAYLDPTEEAAEKEWEAMVHPDLLRARLDAIEKVEASLGSSELSDAEVEAWLSVLNDARLALGSRLDITEEADIDAVPEDDPDRAAHETYAWLTWLQADLVDALLD